MQRWLKEKGTPASVFMVVYLDLGTFGEMVMISLWLDLGWILDLEILGFVADTLWISYPQTFFFLMGEQQPTLCVPSIGRPEFLLGVP